VTKRGTLTSRRSQRNGLAFSHGYRGGRLPHGVLPTDRRQVSSKTCRRIDLLHAILCSAVIAIEAQDVLAHWRGVELSTPRLDLLWKVVRPRDRMFVRTPQWREQRRRG
jgi:hypothetical protein